MKYSSTCFLCLVSQFPSSLRLLLLTYPTSYLVGMGFLCLVSVFHFHQTSNTEHIIEIIFFEIIFCEKELHLNMTEYS